VRTAGGAVCGLQEGLCVDCMRGCVRTAGGAVCGLQEGLCADCRRLVTRVANIAKPLTRLTEEKYIRVVHGS
jgi:hypothetical protein